MRPTPAIISLGLFLALARASSLAAGAVGIYDTNAPTATVLSGSAVAGQAGWTLVVEETTDHKFRGDMVLANERLALAFRRGGAGAELYARGPSGVVCRAVLAPAGTKVGTRCVAVVIVENTASQAMVDATFQPPDAAAVTFRFELQPGQVFVRTEARKAGQRLRIEAPCRFAVLPDFFADDIAISATELPVDRAELPSENGQAFLQPLKNPGRFQGPTLIYPVNRVTATPLSQFTFVDLVRATLGVGPCEYILDVEGQKKQSEGIPTCDARTKLNAIYAVKQQKDKRSEVEQALVDVLAFVRHIRGRIDTYGMFGHEVLSYLEQQKKVHPELAGFVTELETLTRRIDETVAKRIGSIGTPEYATGLAEEFRRTVLDNDGDDAWDKCKKITAAFVQIGGNQDELVGECRLAVKILRQRAGLSMVTDVRTSDIAQEIRRRTQTMLRNPVSYEAPRH